MYDVAIIGGGIIGCATALELARRGAQVVVIDRHGAVGHGSTSASCGIVRTFYSTPTMSAMAHEGRGFWANWRFYLSAGDDEDLARFERTGMLIVPPAIDARINAIIDHMQEIGVNVEVLTRDELERRFPYLDLRSHQPVRLPGDPDFFEQKAGFLDGAIYERDAGYVVSPLLATENLRRAGEKVGVTFRLGCDVTGITPRSQPGKPFVLDLAEGAAIEAGAVLNAAGPHSTAVNRLAGVSLPIEIRPLRREVHAVTNPDYTDEMGSSVPVVGDIDSGVYFRPESGGRELVVGSLDPECDAFEWVDDSDDVNVSVTVAGYERQVMRLMKRYPAVRLAKRRGVAALYDVTLLDWNPVLDKTDLPGFYVAIGTSGSSFKTAPVIGAVMSELIKACEGGYDHDREPLKLLLPRTGFDLDVGFFSRLRAAHATSASVLG